MATKTTAQTLEALNAQIDKLKAQAEVLRRKEVAGVVARIREAIVHYGLTAADLGLDGATAVMPKSIRAAAAKPARKSSGKKPAKNIKFADGQGKTWSGVGKRPNWFKEAIAAGKTPDDLLAKADD